MEAPPGFEPGMEVLQPFEKVKFSVYLSRSNTFC